MQNYGLSWLLQRMPKPANAAPRPEKTGAAIGEQPDRYALADHQHETMRSTTYVTLDTSAKATAMFTRSIGGINALVTALSGYDLFAGSAAGASVSVVAYSRTDTA